MKKLTTITKGHRGKAEPVATRPFMPGYGVAESAKGLLPWKWAEGWLSRSHNYLLVTASRSGAPHAMPVWGVWVDYQFWFSTGAHSRKARNLRENARCVVCTEKVEDAVIVEGETRRIPPATIPPAVAAAYARKYRPWKLDPKLGPVFAVRPRVAFGIVERTLDSSATRWRFA